MHNIKRVSFFFRILFQFLFVLLPVLLVVAWVYAPEPFPISFAGNVIIDFIPRGIPIMHTLSVGTKIAGFIISLIPTAFDLLVLYFLIKLFRLYEQGEIFAFKTVKYIRNAGYALLIGQLVNPIYQALVTPLLTWGNPPGHRMIAITLSGTNIGLILTALLIILISWITAEGYKLREEQNYTI